MAGHRPTITRNNGAVVLRWKWTVPSPTSGTLSSYTITRLGAVAAVRRVTKAQRCRGA
jgi:hypothetical protein